MIHRLYGEKEAILQLDKRKKIYNIIGKYPGIHQKAIERKTKLSTGIVTHHLQYLKKHQIIKENNLKYFPETFKKENQQLISLLRNKSIRRILLCMLTNKQANQQTIAQFIKLTPQTTNWHIKKLAEQQIIKQEKKGREAHYSLLIKEEVLVHLFLTYKKSFLDRLVDRTIDMWDL